MSTNKYETSFKLTNICPRHRKSLIRLVYSVCGFFVLITDGRHPLWRISALISEARKAPIARPESGLEDSDLEESAPSKRVSVNWVDYTLPPVQQITDNVIDIHPRPRANTDHSDSLGSERSSKLQEIASKATSVGSINAKLDYSPANCNPPPKPPRTFETERSEGRQSFRYKPPPKPPRTFEYDSQIQANFSSSLYWNFPRPRALKYPQTQFSSFDFDGSTLSSDSVDGKESEEVLTPYSPHRKKGPQYFRTISDHVDNHSRSNDKDSLFSKQPVHVNGEAVRRPKPRSVESSGPEARISVSDTGLNISQEEEFLLGSVKPRTGRRKRNPLKQAASETLHHSSSNFERADQPLTGLRTNTNFLETTL